MSPSAPICIAVGIRDWRLGIGRMRPRANPYALNPSPSPLSGARRRRRRRHEQFCLVPDEVGLAVDRELVVLAHEDRADRARFFAVTAENAARLVNLVDRRVARTGLNRAVVLRRLEVDGIGRARRRTQPARHALLQAVLVAHQYLLAAVL